MDSFSFFVGTRTETEIYEIMHMHLFGFSVGKVEVPAQPGTFTKYGANGLRGLHGTISSTTVTCSGYP